MMAHKSQTEEERRYLTLYLTHLRFIKPEISGDDIKRLGLPPGPAYRKILDKVHRHKINGKITDRESEMAFLHELVNKEADINSQIIEIRGEELQSIGIRSGSGYTLATYLLKEEGRVKGKREEIHFIKELVKEEQFKTFAERK